MKSYILGIVVAMILSAAYVLSNTAEITVKFLRLETTFSQGIWEVIVFALGILIMWLISVCASVETYIKNRKKTKGLTKRIAQLEDERKSLLDTLRSFGWKDRAEDKPQALAEQNPSREETGGIAKTVCEIDGRQTPEPSGEPEAKAVSDKPELSDNAESRQNADAKPHFLKTLISSLFGREKKPDAGQDAAKTVSDETDAQASGPENVCSIPEIEPDEEKYDTQAAGAENVCCSIPDIEIEETGEEYDARTSAETEDKEKSEI
jgi:uncharacterized membrane protein YciS (DUF1049 family)